MRTRLTESDLTRIVRRVINEQEGEISQALDGLSSQFVSMMKNVVGKYPTLSNKATESKTSLDNYINKAKKMQLEPDDQTAEIAFDQLMDLLTLRGKGGYLPVGRLRQIFSGLRFLETRTGFLNPSYKVTSNPKIIGLINRAVADLRKLSMLK